VGCESSQGGVRTASRLHVTRFRVSSVFHRVWAIDKAAASMPNFHGHRHRCETKQKSAATTTIRRRCLLASTSSVCLEPIPGKLRSTIYILQSSYPLLCEFNSKKGATFLVAPLFGIRDIPMGLNHSPNKYSIYHGFSS
jgi:hypothetical protein